MIMKLAAKAVQLNVWGHRALLVHHPRGASQPEQAEEILEGDDGVSSEGEKTLPTEEGEEEGREAEASPSTNSRVRNMRGGNSARRSVRTSIPRGNMPRSGPTPIIWGDQRSPGGQRHHPQGDYK
ncbi:hypothetical protein NQ318_003816 [Aromia moschata]|uniref:Uncharacterized protein n=1 Tax=Aromia moschata TaxID=1265417 RepID=A0AAV8XVJ2_9CUCU|nr:hypothetical protein NQ318_003816 [Aromia moschata]